MTDQQNDNGQLLPHVDEASGVADVSLPQTSGANPAPQADTTAADVDIIEKAWIDKAKHIVDKTSSDPFEQQKMISEVKADYIKKRFNKDIKINDE
ncbi:MAG: hypothetical protein AAB914_03535 [Patescibacteria group bacterium]